jgi:hypothetical protein
VTPVGGRTYPQVELRTLVTDVRTLVTRLGVIPRTLVTKLIERLLISQIACVTKVRIDSGDDVRLLVTG